MNNKRNTEKNSLKIYFDEKKNIIKSKVEVVTYDKDGNRSRAVHDYEGLENVNDSLISFLSYNPESNLKKLIDEKIIKIDSSVALRYNIDFEKKVLIEKVLRRRDRRIIEGRSYDDEEIKYDSAKDPSKKDADDKAEKSDKVDKTVKASEEDKKVTEEKTKIVDKTEEKKDSEEEKKSNKWLIKLKKVYRKPIAWVSTVVLVGGIAAVASTLKNHSNDNADANNYPTYRVDIDNNGQQYSYNTSDDVYRADVDNNGYYDGSYDTNQSYYNNYGRYADLGSSVDYDDIVTQLDTIDNSVMRREQLQYENLVVPDDYDAIYSIRNMRDNVLNGTCSQKDFMDTLVQYVFEDGNYVNGNFIEKYQSLKPFAKYIVIRISQGALQWDTNYVRYGSMRYDFNNLASIYDSFGSDLYTILTQNTKTR